MKRRYMQVLLILAGVLLLSGCARGSKTGSGRTDPDPSKKAGQTDPIQTEQAERPSQPELSASAAADNMDREEDEILTNEGGIEEEAALRNLFSSALPFTGGDDKICAIAYMGDTPEIQNDNLKAFYAKYFADYGSEQLSIPAFDYGGEECYLIIPRYRESTVSLKRMEWKEQQLKEVQSDVAESDAFLLYCNPSGEYANTEVEIAYQNKSFVIMPRLSTVNHRIENMQIALDLTEESVYQ